MVGIRYERTDTQTPYFDFHFYFVEVKSGTEPQQIQNIIGEIESLRYYVLKGQLAADTATFYVAIPTEEVPQDLHTWAMDNKVGILTLNTNDEPVIVREKLAPTPVDRDEKRSEVLSHNDQRSAGTFKTKICATSVLKRVVYPEPFFESLIRREQEELKSERDRKKAIDYIDNPDAQEAMHDVVSIIENQDELTIRPHSGRPRLFVDTEQEERILQIQPQRSDFKILNRNGDTLFRIEAKNQFDITQESVTDFDQLESYIQETVL